MENAAIVPLLIISFAKFLEYYSYILIVRLLLTWFPNIDWMQQIIGFLSPITDPYLNLFRFIPPVGMLDLSPILAIFALQFAMQAFAALTPVLLG
ncbi:YggT family protein [Chamaesiphon polymorphus]|uniref:YggT family protein n=1 Tax=Chamaesiphon polymorphus TaxID=2107691 RepID=UPI0015E78BF9|nr:YggT family protein [Chamaesiphon polymorphus]